MVERLPITMAGWPKGMDNRRKDYNLPRDALRDALNVDILTSGMPRMRYGPRQILADTGAHSGYTDGAALFWATANALKRMVPGSSPVSLLTDVRLAKPLSMVSLHGDTYFSNELVNGIVNGYTGTVEPWGIVPPAAPPTVSGNGGIRLVGITCAFVAQRTFFDGTPVLEESGAPLAVQVACSDTPSVRLTNIPQSSDSRVVATRIYATGLDGKEFFRVVDLPAGLTSFTLTPGSGTAPTWGEGEPLKTLLDSNPPPGQLIDYGNGRIFIATGNVVYNTEPLRYGLYDNDKSFTYFPKRVTLARFVPASNEGPAGLFVSAERTYFIENAGTPEARPILKLEYKAIEGASIRLPKTDEVMWLSERGFVLGKPGGKVVNLTEDQIAVDQYQRAAMGLMEMDGHRSVITVGVSSNPTPLLSQDWVADETERLSEVE